MIFAHVAITKEENNKALSVVQVEKKQLNQAPGFEYCKKQLD